MTIRYSVTLCVLLIVCATNLKIHQQYNKVTYDSLMSKYDTSSSDYKYYDNLNSPQANYYYGGITKESYEMSVKLQKLDGYQQCESATPYTKKSQGSCMSCPADKPLFNLGSRECEACKPRTSTKCDSMFNYNTPAYNNTQSSTSSTSSSTKPATTVNITKPTTTNTTKPVNATSYVVEWKPKPNNESKTSNATSTTENNYIDIFEPVPVTSSNDSLHQNYTIDYRVVNNNTNQTNQANETLIAQSQGQNATFYNQECPSVTPYYNPTTKTCENCKDNEEYVAAQKKCLPIIFVSNPKTKYVILKTPDQLLKANLNITQSYPERTVRFCEIDKPLAINGVCIACSGEKIFNFTSQECQDGCPDGQVFSESNSQCIPGIFLTNSDAPNLLSPIKDFEDFRSAQKLRMKSSPTIVECPLTKPIFINGKCSVCPDGHPFFNIESQNCEMCQRNRNYNSFTRRCEAPSDSGFEIKKIVPNIF